MHNTTRAPRRGKLEKRDAMTDTRRLRTALPALRALALALAVATLPGLAREQPKPSAPTMLPIPASGVIGVEDAYFAPQFWIARTPQADARLLDRAAIDARNARLLREDVSMFSPWQTGQRRT